MSDFVATESTAVMKDHILIADDDPDVISTLTYLLETEHYRVSSASNPDDALALLAKNDFNLVVVDLNYSKDTTSGQEGFELIHKVKQLNDQLPIVVMTAWGSVETAVEAMQQGARDFVQKPWENERLLSIIGNQILLQKAETRTQKLAEENQLLRGQLGSKDSYQFSQSEVMSALLEQVDRLAQSDASILLTGENGTGKSYLAQQIHDLSARKNRSLISVNMSSITKSLFESEMFGHVKGAFTGAVENRIGRFELADEGTLFLDEIADTPYSQQPKLLRVLENAQFEKVGSSRTQQTDFRLICATNCDLDEAVESDRFRKDLLYRINTVTLRVPSLRERAQDIIPLAESFLTRYRRKYSKPQIYLGDRASELLTRYEWPGNIRELSHMMERSVILCTAEEIGPSDLGIGNQQGERTSYLQDYGSSTLEEIQRAIIEKRLSDHKGNSLEAAQSLGLSKSAFYRHLKKHKI